MIVFRHQAVYSKPTKVYVAYAWAAAEDSQKLNLNKNDKALSE